MFEELDIESNGIAKNLRHYNGSNKYIVITSSETHRKIPPIQYILELDGTKNATHVSTLECRMMSLLHKLTQENLHSLREKRPSIDVLHISDIDSIIRSPLTHGFWFLKVVAMGEEWYRGRFVEKSTVGETGNLPVVTDPTGHLGFSAINEIRWLLTHHWFGGNDTLANKELYSKNTTWFFDAAKPLNSVMGVFAMFRYGLLNEDNARLAVHQMINIYSSTERSILANGIWIHVMIAVLDGSKKISNPLQLTTKKAVQNEINVLVTHHFFGNNNNNTVSLTDNYYKPLTRILNKVIRNEWNIIVGRKKILELFNS